MVHISELEPRRVNKVTDVVNEGDEVKVKVLAVDRGKVKLSMKVVDQATGAEILPAGNEKTSGAEGAGQEHQIDSSLLEAVSWLSLSSVNYDHKSRVF